MQSSIGATRRTAACLLWMGTIESLSPNKSGRLYLTLGMEFPNREAVIVWMLKNQLGRRNVTPMQRDMLLARLYHERVKAGSEFHRIPR